MDAAPVQTPTPSSPYVHVRTLSEGGMGIVDLALREEGDFRRLYAIKRLQPQFRNDDEFRAMFLDEARIAGLIRHPNVVSVLDVGEDERGPYLVMDFVDGIPLSTLIAERPGDARIPVQIAVRIALEAARGLHAAHELCDHDGQPLGLVHRDVSPQNMMVGFDGGVRVTDFGIAKALGRSTRTHTGVLKGKLGYMSPEQLRFQEPDRRADLFALGVVLYELLAGARLYRNEHGHDGVRRILDEPPPDIADVRADVPAEVVELLFSLLAKDPEARPSTAAETARRLEEILAELIALEGPFDVGPYLEATFPGLREQRRTQLDESLQTAVTRPDPRFAIGRPTQTTGLRRRRASSGARTWLVAITTAVVFASGAWFLARATVDDGRPASVLSPPEEVRGPPAGASRAPGVAGPPRAAAPAPEPALPSGVDAPARIELPDAIDRAAPVADGTSPEPERAASSDARRPRPRARRRRRRQAPRASDGSSAPTPEPGARAGGVRTFGWDDR